MTAVVQHAVLPPGSMIWSISSCNNVRSMAMLHPRTSMPCHGYYGEPLLADILARLRRILGTSASVRLYLCVSIIEDLLS